MRPPVRRALAYMARTSRYLPLWIPRPWMARATDGGRP